MPNHSIIAQRTFERLSAAEQDAKIAEVEKLSQGRREQSVVVENDQRRNPGRRRRDFTDQQDNDFMLVADQQLDEQQN